MITIKIIILYFIQFGHTDDFPSTGTRLVRCKNLTLTIRDCVSLVERGSSVVVPFQNLGKFVYPTCLCLSDETLKAIGPFYLVSMPGEVKYPTQGKNV